MNAPYVIIKERKSLGLAIVLTVLFGPFGLFYATIWGGLVMTIFAPLMFFLLIVLGMAWESGLILSLSLGIYLAFILADWLTSIIWAITSVNKHNREVAKAVQQQMLIMNSFQAKGNTPIQLSVQHTSENTPTQGQIKIEMAGKPPLKDWLKANPGKTINDYFVEFGR